MNGGSRATLAALVMALAVLVPGSAAAGWAPGVVATAGGTFAVSGVPDEGGLSFSVSPMWDVQDRITAGLLLSADDMGTELGQLMDPNDGSNRGATPVNSSWLTALAFRMDAEWGSIASWMPFASGTWGWYRIIDDKDFGQQKGKDVDALGWSLGGGVRWPVAERQALGVSMRYHRVFSDRVGRFMSWSLDWNFR